MSSFFSAASALLTGKSSPFPNFVIGERDAWFDGRTIWQLHNGVKKDDGSACSILIFDALQPAHNPRKSLLPLAKNALRRLRTTRHPDVVKLLDSLETPTAIYIAIERARPLGKVLADMHKATQLQREEWIGWGLSRIVNALRFLHTDMCVTHGNVRSDSIFLATSGEWRLGGFDLMSKATDDPSEGILYTLGGMVPDAARYAPPEVKQQGWGVLRDLGVHVSDSYALALIILESYNGTLPPRGPSDVSVPPRGRVPEDIYSHVKRMMLPNARSRSTMGTFAEAGFRNPGGFFTENRLCKVAVGLDGFVLASEEQRSDVLRTIKSSSSSFPPDFLQYKVLPVLVHAMSFGNSTTNNVNATNASHNTNNGIGSVPQTTLTSPTMHAGRLLPLILQLGQPLSDEDWKSSVAQTIIKTFGSPDRAVRMALLESLPSYVDRFDAKQVSDRIWPNLLTGFGDSSAAMREATVRAIVPLSPKLTERILNNDLLRQLARTQVDAEPRIRTNTTVLLGNLAPKLSLTTRKNVLIPAFVRSLKDGFAHARMAGLMAFMATAESFDGADCAKQIVPAMCPCLLDADKAVRRQAKEVVTMLLAKVQEAADGIPPSSEDTELADGAMNGFAPTSNGPGHTSGNSLFSPIDPRFNEDVSTTASTVTSSSAAAVALAAMGPPSSAPRMKEDEANDYISNGTLAPSTPPPNWASMGDLMDVMDDEDDWTSFSSATPKPQAAAAAAAAVRAPTSHSRVNEQSTSATKAPTTTRLPPAPAPAPASVSGASIAEESPRSIQPLASRIVPVTASHTINAPSSSPASTLPIATRSNAGTSTRKAHSQATTLKTVKRPGAGSVQKAVHRRTLAVQDKANDEGEEEEAWDW